MTEYDNTNRGVLFKNDRKESDKHPDYKGNVNVNGVEFWLSAWIKEGAKGKFMSLSIQPKEVQPKPAEQSISQRAMPKGPPARDQFTSGLRKDDMDDSIPF